MAGLYTDMLASGARCSPRSPRTVALAPDGAVRHEVMPPRRARNRTEKGNALLGAVVPGRHTRRGEHAEVHGNHLSGAWAGEVLAGLAHYGASTGRTPKILTPFRRPFTGQAIATVLDRLDADGGTSACAATVSPTPTSTCCAGSWRCSRTTLRRHRLRRSHAVHEGVPGAQRLPWGAVSPHAHPLADDPAEVYVPAPPSATPAACETEPRRGSPSAVVHLKVVEDAPGGRTPEQVAGERRHRCRGGRSSRRLRRARARPRSAACSPRRSGTPGAAYRGCAAPAAHCTSAPRRWRSWS